MTTDNTPTGSPAMSDENEVLRVYSEACEHADTCQQGFSYGRKQALMAVYRFGKAHAAIAARPPEPAPVAALSDERKLINVALGMMDSPKDANIVLEVSNLLRRIDELQAKSDDYDRLAGVAQWRRIALEKSELASQPVAPAEPVTDAMVTAYLEANNAYWQRTDQLPKPPDKWRTGTVHEATKESLRAALAAAPQAGPVTDAQIDKLVAVNFAYQRGTMEPDEWRHFARAVLALRQPAESAQEAGK